MKWRQGFPLSYFLWSLTIRFMSYNGKLNVLSASLDKIVLLLTFLLNQQ